MTQLEFLDLSAGVKTARRDEEDDFDYIYHLPLADPSRIIRRDPFVKKLDGGKSDDKMQSTSQLSMAAKHSIRDLRSMLDPDQSRMAKHRALKINRRHEDHKSSNSQLSQIGSKSMMPSMSSFMGGSQNLKMDVSNAGSEENFSGKNPVRIETSSNQKSYLTPARRLSNVSKSMASISPVQMHKSNFSFNMALNDVDDGSKNSMDSGIDNLIPFKDVATFRALPRALTRYVNANHIAILGLAIVLASVIQVVVGIVS